MLSKEEKQSIVVEYRDNLTPMIDLAKIYKVTRQGIFKVLKKAGVDTSKAQRIKRNCRVCGEEVLRRRGRARDTKFSYCSEECYHIYLTTLGEEYRPSNYHSRLARRMVSDNFPEYDPKKGHTVHYVDKDCEHNALKNLEVYASQSDHLRKHRGYEIEPIWKGSF